MECLLHKAGYPTTVNGHFSAADAQELAKFRKSIGLNPLLVGGRRAWSALLSRGTTPHLQAGDKGKNVLRLQLALRSAGFAKIPTKGRYGAATAGVIKVVQKSQHLKRTGEVNADSGRGCKPARSSRRPSVKKPVPKPVSKAPKTHTKGEKALAFAKNQLGDPYVRNAAGPNGLGLLRPQHEGLEGGRSEPAALGRKAVPHR